MMNVYIVHSLDMINYLCRCGNDIIKIEDSQKDPTGKFKVCIFADTDKLHSDLSEYMIKRTKTETEGNKYVNN